MKQETIIKIKGYVSGLPPHTTEMDEHIDRLRTICSNPVVEAAFNEALAHVSPYTETGEKNPWQSACIEDFIDYFDAWFTDIPVRTGGLGFILPFTWFYYNNTSAYFFLNGLKTKSVGAEEFTKEIFIWAKEFIFIRGAFMDSPASAPKDVMEEWLTDPGTHIHDFDVPKGGFKSFNEFFTRELNPDVDPRPI